MRVHLVYRVRPFSPWPAPVREWMATVSIGIPTYNRSDLLRQAIQSVLQQTWQDFEVIVSDDCSTDDTATVVQGFNDDRIKYFRTATNLRPPRNWNQCVRMAGGEFFGLLPDDDVYCPTFLSEMLAALRAQPQAAFAQCSYYQVDAQLRCLSMVRPASQPLSLKGESALAWQIERLACAPVALLFRRSTMLDLGLWREDYWDDWAFIIRLAYRFGFTFVSMPLACARAHEANLNQQLRAAGRDPILDLINQQADVFAEALPASAGLIKLRAKLNRQLSQHCLLLALGALRRRNWRRARLHFERARNLYALAGFDPGVVKLWLHLRTEARRMRAEQEAAQRAEPIINLAP